MAGQISDTVRVTAQILPAGVRRREFGNTLYLSTADTVVRDPAYAQLIRTVRTYPDADALASGEPTSVTEAADIYFQQVPFPRNLLVATCLLYTSPSPRDRTRSRMPSSA